MTNSEQTIHFAAEYMADGVNIIRRYRANPKHYIVVPFQRACGHYEKFILTSQPNDYLIECVHFIDCFACSPPKRERVSQKSKKQSKPKKQPKIKKQPKPNNPRESNRSGPQRTYSDEMVYQILTSHKNGKTVKQLAIEYNKSVSAMKSLINRAQNNKIKSLQAVCKSNSIEYRNENNQL